MSRPRPSAPIRAAVLLVAVAALAFTMCSHARSPATRATPQAPDAGQKFFPATKAPGPLIPEPR